MAPKRNDRMHPNECILQIIISKVARLRINLLCILTAYVSVIFTLINTVSLYFLALSWSFRFFSSQLIHFSSNVLVFKPIQIAYEAEKK